MAGKTFSQSRPRLGFLGVGWIGRHRMQAVRDAGAAKVVAVADDSPAAGDAALALAPEAQAVGSLDELLALGLDGVVIATPSALHASQVAKALEAGVAVFCQKPLGRSRAETSAVIAAAAKARRLLGVDLCYRRTVAMQAVVPLVQSGELGRIFAVDLTFHNAYGPDKSWFYDRRLAGGGCLMDLGIHLIDLALWTLQDRPVEVEGFLAAKGGPINGVDQVEDFARVRLTLASGCDVAVNCSWNLHAGQDAVIAATFHGEKGSAGFRNVGGSFYDFLAERCIGTSRQIIAEGPDEWGGRTVLEWVERLGAGEHEDRSLRFVEDAAGVIDSVYHRCGFKPAELAA